MVRFSKLIFSLAALLVFAAAGVTVRAGTITVVGVNSGQFSTATVVCEFTPKSNLVLFNTLTFTITNTSHITHPGSTSTITSIGFDLPPLGSTSLSGLNDFDGFMIPSPLANFSFKDFNVGPVPGFAGAVLDFAFTTPLSSSFASGSVANGLAPGESVSFIVTGPPFAQFTEDQICNAIFVMFQDVPLAAGTGGSDVGISETPVPEPSSILLLGSALVGLSAGNRIRETLRPLGSSLLAWRLFR